MNIEQIELRLLEMPYVHYFETSFGREEKKTFLLVRMFAQGLCGYGEVTADSLPLYNYETKSTCWVLIKEVLVPLLFSQSISDPIEFHRAAAKYKGHHMAKAGLELALWDLKAKSESRPLSQLYGGNKKEVLSGVSIGIQDRVSDLLERIGRFLEKGYPRVKLKIKPGWDVSILKQVRKEFPDIPLQVDANCGYRSADLDWLPKLDEFDLALVEQPFPAWDLLSHSKLKKKLKTPLCLDESAVSWNMVRQAYEMESFDIINIKVGRVGGVVEAQKIHDFCESKAVPVWCGGMLESGIGRAHNIHIATLPNFKLTNDISASQRYFAQDLIEPPVEITKQGRIQVPEGPGIGVTPVEERIQKATLKREVLTSESLG
ncbi:MAG: o-succinylbenzoate synthase [Candidatus Aminicenantes bacterium]|nr:o-succinylbenzoate synthase [Candidatus Aminicenantes bacterium]